MPRTLHDKLRQLAAEFMLDEVVINTWAHDPKVRRRSYALLAEEFGLVPPSSAAAGVDSPSASPDRR